MIYGVEWSRGSNLHSNLNELKWWQSILHLDIYRHKEVLLVSSDEMVQIYGSEWYVGSAFLRSLYGCTDHRNDVITGNLFYDGDLLSSSEILMLVSYIDSEGWLCDSFTVEEYISHTIQLNFPAWV